jgi:hypothetical protein
VNIDSRTLRVWMTRASKGQAKYVEFRETIESAIARGRIKLLGQIARHGNREFRAPAWILEHAHSAEFGPKAQVKISLEQDRYKLLTIAENVLSQAQFDKLLAALTAEDASAVGEGDAGAEEGEE